MSVPNSYRKAGPFLSLCKQSEIGTVGQMGGRLRIVTQWYHRGSEQSANTRLAVWHAHTPVGWCDLLTKMGFGTSNGNAPYFLDA